MYNLNVNVNAAGAAGLLGVEGSCTTPKTPEILNSLIAMTNPFDGYAGNGGGGSRGPRIASVPPGHSSMGDNSSSSSSGQSSCRSPLASPTGGEWNICQLRINMVINEVTFIVTENTTEVYLKENPAMDLVFPQCFQNKSSINIFSTLISIILLLLIRVGYLFQMWGT